jgi:hypothetical protein
VSAQARGAIVFVSQRPPVGEVARRQLDGEDPVARGHLDPSLGGRHHVVVGHQRVDPKAGRDGRPRVLDRQANQAAVGLEGDAEGALVDADLAAEGRPGHDADREECGQARAHSTSV